MSKTLIPITVPLDPDGFLRRECPHCIREFKSRIAAIDQVESYFCPYCGRQAQADAWWTKEQLLHMRDVAGDYAESLIRKAFGGISRSSSSMIKVKVPRQKFRAKPLPLDEDQLSPDGPGRLVTPGCHTEVPVKVFDWSEDVRCFICGSAVIAANDAGAARIESVSVPGEDMNMDAKAVEERERARETVLRAAHQLSDGNERQHFHLDELVRVTGLAKSEVKLAFQHLHNQDLVVPTALGGTCGITHRGVLAFERLVKGPKSASPSHQVVQNFHGPVGAVQTGNSNTAQVRQEVGFVVSEVLDLIASLRTETEALPIAIRVDAQEQLDDVKEEVAGAAKPSRIRAALLALWLITSAAANFAPKVTALAEKLHVLLPPG